MRVRKLSLAVGKRRSAAHAAGRTARVPACTLALAAALALAACRTGVDKARARAEADSLNRAAYELRYTSARRALALARRACTLASGPAACPDGRDEALCHIAFLQYMLMDYAAADSALALVYARSDNQVLKLTADVVGMRICQRRSANQQFYDYCNSARRRIALIRTEEGSLAPRQRRLFLSALSDYHLALVMYYYYVRQEDEARAEFRVLADSIVRFAQDSTQLAMYYYLSGNVRNINNQLHEGNWQDMAGCLDMAREKGYEYIEAKALLAIAADLIQTRNFRPARMARLREIIQADATADDAQVGPMLCRRALRIFRRYGSLFDESETYLTLADHYLYRGETDRAFRLLQKALDCVNRHYIRSNPADRTRFRPLRPYSTEPDSLSQEMRLIHRPDLICVPEWMADVREHLCLVYSAMGMKPQSDYNRNIYLDILDAIRQDRRTEQRLEQLRSEERKVMHSVVVTAAVMALLVLLALGAGRRLRTRYRKRYELEKKTVEAEMERWRERIDARFSTLEDRQAEVEAERYCSERNLHEQKRQYVDKATCLSIVFAVIPFLDRALNEVRKLGGRAPLTARRLAYISELAGRIDLYNGILTHWIKVRRGIVALNVENFNVAPLLDIVRKGEAAFAAKDIQLTVGDSDAIVKADRALTLFMMNTLLENARKYTRPGGSVRLTVQDEGEAVRFAVTDTGRGLSEEDCRKINEEKVYDSSRIGDVDHDPDLRKNKGSGFGLMNCKGIVEKYRKTSAVFAVCRFGVESAPGKGSTFFFRLPKGVMHAALLALLTLAPFAHPYAAEAQTRDGQHGTAADGRIRKAGRADIVLRAAESESPLLRRAADFADSTYYANVDHRYARALQFADSACRCLNAFYKQRNPGGQLLLGVSHRDDMPEMEWWRSGLRTDYYVILDLRNEAAIAALALKEWKVYYYNNEIYTRLYKLMAQDGTLEQYCNSIRAANAHKQTALTVIGLLLALAFLAGFYFYYRSRILPMFNLRQMLEAGHRIFDNEEPGRLAQVIYDGVNDILPVDGVCLLLPKGEMQRSAHFPQLDYLEEVMRSAQAAGNGHAQVLAGGLVRIWPLVAHDRERDVRVGTVAFVLHRTGNLRDEDEMLSALAKYAATNLYYASVRMERLAEDIQMADDERRRTEMEMNRVHVQNMVLDNCLSAIKHETMYYPSRIRHVADTLLRQAGTDGDGGDSSATRAQTDTLCELTAYYKSVYTLLANCAARQTGHVSFRRTTVDVKTLADYAATSFRKQAARLKKEGVDVRFLARKTGAQADGLRVKGDLCMLQYLMENAISAFLQYRKDGTWSIDFAESDNFIKFACGFDNIQMDEEQMRSLFYPESVRYDELTGRLTGAQFLIARQIVREHDDHVRRGCRIYAEPLLPEGRGVSLVFTVPKA